MQMFKITVKIPKPVDDVFEYITTPLNFPRWKKDVWIAGQCYGEMGVGFKMIQTIYLMSPRQFMMHVTGFEKNKYFKFEALKGFMALPSWSFYFESCEDGTLLSVLSELNGTAISGLVYPLGLSWHWRLFLELLSKELFGKRGKIERVSFKEMPK